MISLLGLPGLYQNWIISVLDANSASRVDGNNNFITNSNHVNWIKKLDLDYNQIELIDQPAINCYVNDKNFVWYLYNFLEKTDGVEIQVDSLIHDLFTKAKGTEAFDGLLDHLIIFYNLDTQTDSEYQQNAAIEYFYFVLLEKESKFKTLAAYQNLNFVNIEYQDFNSYTVMNNHLRQITGFDPTRFEYLYQQLRDRNNKYLSRQQKFLSKLDNQDINFDILEWAYIGVLVYWQDGTTLDWFNPGVRQNVINHRWNDICIYANKLL
jgi:hypothetical protein